MFSKLISNKTSGKFAGINRDLKLRPKVRKTANMIIVVGLLVSRGELFTSQALSAVLFSVFSGITVSALVSFLLPFLEYAFKVTTDISLLELLDLNQPVMKMLMINAPGTYHHSVIVGNLVEAAAEAVGVNPLLGRVSSYYHDIGKIKMPDYFVENQGGTASRHDKLTPHMSSMIITSHLKEGVELAKQYKLPQTVIDIIQQHHGTALITYFYQKAKSQEDPESAGGVDETSYRYPGPKPQTKEAGLVMLADAIEAASKTLDDPTPDKLQWLTQKIVNKIFTDGQLDECELTLKDLHSITRSFNRVFAGIYHQRIDYPEPAYITKEERVEGPDRGEGAVAERASGKDKEDVRDRLKRLGIR